MNDEREERQVLIIDAYNVIRQDPEYRRLLEVDPDVARARLVDRVASHAAGRFEAMVVFDAHGNPGADGAPHEIAGVTVVFSPAGVEADAIIESRVHDALGEGATTVVVVTSDGETRRVVERRAVQVVSSRSFLEEINRDWESANGDSSSDRSPIEERVDEATRDALMRWARGR